MGCFCRRRCSANSPRPHTVRGHASISICPTNSPRVSPKLWGAGKAGDKHQSKGESQLARPHQHGIKLSPAYWRRLGRRAKRKRPAPSGSRRSGRATVFWGRQSIWAHRVGWPARDWGLNGVSQWPIGERFAATSGRRRASRAKSCPVVCRGESLAGQHECSDELGGPITGRRGAVCMMTKLAKLICAPLARFADSSRS